jgi:hypothetical protein
MSYRIIYDGQYFRTWPSCIIDNRIALGLGNATGAQMEAYIQPQLAMVNPPTTLPYKLETINGNLAGIFLLNIHPSDGATVLYQVIRPAFQSDLANVNAAISTFILNNDWQFDL